MALDLDSPKADELVRQFAQMEGVSLTEAVTIAMQEAIARRRTKKSVRDTVSRVLKEHGITPSATASQTLPREVYDEMWEDKPDER